MMESEALRDQSQVFLPINNALSSVGHVHGFLKEIGQGVQHIASRVSNLVDFVQRCNDYRDITGEGTQCTFHILKFYILLKLEFSFQILFCFFRHRKLPTTLGYEALLLSFKR